MDPVPASKPGPPPADPGYHRWEAPCGSTIVHLSLDVIERLLGEVMTGFGAIPRRGAEVGGILIGRIEGQTVRIDDFEVVACEYRRGPSYLLSENDKQAFASAYQRWASGAGLKPYAVGYFRSNTREQFATGDEDRELMRHYFPHAPHMMLLIRPYATRTSIGGFVSYENGDLRGVPAHEFPFLRNELDGAPRRARRGVTEITLERPQQRIEVEPQISLIPDGAGSKPHDETNSESPRRRRRWPWLAACALLLVAGSVGGFTAAISMLSRGNIGAAAGDPYSLSLAVSKAEDSLHLRWDRQSQAIRSAQRGALEISDGAYSKTVELDESQLHNGSVIYHNLTNQVTFRLVVYGRGRNSVSESVDWKQ